MPLPTAKSPAQARMGKVFLYGEPKTAGKSTLAMTLDPDHTIGFDVEDGLGAIEGYKHRINNWGNVASVRQPTDEEKSRGIRQPVPVFDDHSFRGTVQMLHAERETHPFRVAVVDTADALSDLCNDYVLSSLGADRGGGFVHASDFEYGKGWSAVRKEWELRIGALCRVMESVILISHAKITTKLDRTGAEYPVFTPALGPSGVREFTLGFVDHILLAMVDTNDDGELVHCVRTQPGRGWEAGGRTVAGGPKLMDPIWLPDALTSGEVLRRELEAVSAPAQQQLDTTDTEPEPKPKAKRKDTKAPTTTAAEPKATPQGTLT